MDYIFVYLLIIELAQVFGHASPKETILLSKENFQKFMEDAEAEMDADDETSPTILLLKKFLYK